MLYTLKAKRIERGIKQIDFSKQLGITPQYLCRIEKGEIEPRRDLMMKIAELLDEDVKELFFKNSRI
ncbi:helix-turn-helix transcriptional regulator [Clostridium tyrobutyricum]|jgi:putative transcriptional regulator|uniref:helix-turn-helix transcriptional regulator n=1 Tax=Clostridium tyrobutyricum TaxID=1519 RepID=UPI0010AAF9AC|nr:helix-turn-helix transcriptional regulator [Clostridium tyrobutyricum]MBR9648184.1 helix-turn-helix transcriptional regulator [Clostridium tyrobutyricum]MEA5009151.1 helix-turn-helix transcriptional regulator [Clostridium tyrobutyricum]QCH29476.1 helix-turn-helix protein [Clostridium tyrobutyricum]